MIRDRDENLELRCLVPQPTKCWWRLEKAVQKLHCTLLWTMLSKRLLRESRYKSAD